MLIHSLIIIIAAAFLVKLHYVFQAVKAVKGLPKIVAGFPTFSIIGMTLPTCVWNPGIRFTWDWKDMYKKRSSELISIVPLVFGQPVLCTCSPEIMNQVLGFDASFEKSQVMIEEMSSLGPNLAGSSGDQWRRHRKVATPAFNTNTFRDVWKETARIYEDMVNTEGWSAADTLFFKSFNIHTTKVALHVISACGFGVRLPWDAPPISKGKAFIHEIIATVASSINTRLLTPRWAYSLPVPHLRKVENAYVEFEEFMKDHIASRKSEFRRQSALGGDAALDDDGNLFGRLIKASEADGCSRLDDRELLGNYFIFLFAGHETTAHTLVVTLALLGLYQDEQDKVSEHIRKCGPDFSFENIHELSPVLSCFYEALRLYPAAYMMIREAIEDTMLTYPSISHPGIEERFLVRRGMQIGLDLIGANRNPRCFPEPGLFKPSRRDETLVSVTTFSQGPRGCIGRKFATTEATCFLAHILRDWKVDVVLNEGETAAQWESRVMYPKIGLTLTMGDIPLRFMRRAV